MSAAIYLETSAILRAVLETGVSPEIERRLGDASVLLTSRLTLVEAARALIRLRQSASVAEARLADTERGLDALWARCDLWELTPAVCDLAAAIVPTKPLRTLDALHLATFVLARRRLGDVELLTADRRLAEAAELG
ncbi:MAG: type II toxin-antitoxin system VapC family toxin [Gemmatimonadaceae bacterium]